MSKVDPTLYRTPFFPGQDVSQVKRRSLLSNNAQKKSELDEISKDHTKVAINQKVKDFSKIKKVVDLSPDLDRQKRIEELKQQINNGTYKVDPGKIAEKIMNNEY